MRNLILVPFLVALTYCLTIRSKTNISLNNTKTPLSTQQPIPEPHKQDELPMKEKSNVEDFNNASSIVVTTVTRVYPQDNEQFYEYKQVLPLEDFMRTGPIKALTLGNETIRERGNTTVLLPRANEQTGNTTSVDKEMISQNQSHSNPNQSQIQQKQKDTIAIIPMPNFYNNNQTQNKGIQQKPQSTGQQKEVNQTKSQDASEKGGEEKEGNNNEKRRDQVIEKTEKQKEQGGQNSTQNNKAAEGDKPLALTNNTNRQSQKQNGSKIIPIVFPFEPQKRNESKVENQTSQEQNKKQKNSSLVPIIIPGIAPGKDENENKQPIRNNQSITQNTTQGNLIIIPQSNQITHKNTTSVQNIQNDTKFSDSQFTQNQENNSTKQTQVPLLPIPIDENNTQSSQKQPKRNQIENIGQNKTKENSKNETKIDPIVPIVLPITNQKNQTNSTHPNFTNPLIEHNSTSQNNNQIILAPPITSPELVPQNTTPEKQQNYGQVTMVAFSCTQITNQPQRDTCKDLNGCNWLWDQYEERCGKSGGNILAIYGPSTTQIISKQELAHLKWKN